MIGLASEVTTRNDYDEFFTIITRIPGYSVILRDSVIHCINLLNKNLIEPAIENRHRWVILGEIQDLKNDMSSVYCGGKNYL